MNTNLPSYTQQNSRREKENPPSAATETAGLSKQIASKSRALRPGSKLHSVLSELVRGVKLTRFDAERHCHDHCLNSTISELQDHGLQIHRKPITVQGHLGKPTRCALYWLEPCERQKAAKLLGRQLP